jgi:hypothetical protein
LSRKALPIDPEIFVEGASALDQWTAIKGKPFITVSSKGIVNGLSNIPNDGADFGPDTTLGATAPGQYGGTYTETVGIDEACTYADTVNNNISMQPGTYTIDSGISFMNHSHAILYGNGATIKANSIMTAILTINPSMTNSNASTYGLAQKLINLNFDGNSKASYGLYVLNGFGGIFENLNGTNCTSYWIYFDGSGSDSILGGVRLINLNDDFSSVNNGSLYLLYPSASGNTVRLVNCTFNGSSYIYTSGFTQAVNCLFKGAYLDGNDALDLVNCYFYSSSGTNFVDFNSNNYALRISADMANIEGCIFDTSGASSVCDVIANDTNPDSEIRINGCYFVISADLTVNIYTPHEIGYSCAIVGKDNIINFSSNSGITLNYFSGTIDTTYQFNVEFIYEYLPSSITLNTEVPSPIMPSVPASGTAQKNTNLYTVDVYLYGGTVSEIQITKNSTAYTVFSNSTGLALSGQAYKLNPSDSITVTYTTAPTWEWLSD